MKKSELKSIIKEVLKDTKFKSNIELQIVDLFKKIESERIKSYIKSIGGKIRGDYNIDQDAIDNLKELNNIQSIEEILNWYDERGSDPFEELIMLAKGGR